MTPQDRARRDPYVAWYGRGRKQNWTTPRSLFDSWNAEYGFTMDGASEPGNGLLSKASTAEEPLSWRGERVFCNPPWSNIGPFVENAADADLAVLLVPARTNARWFHRALELGAQVRYFLGRPSFESGPDDQKGHNSPVDCVLLVFGDEPIRERYPLSDTRTAQKSEWVIPCTHGAKPGGCPVASCPHHGSGK